MTTAESAATLAGDESAFAALVEPHRRELQLHCYRMLGSFEDSEDLTQETFLRAWRKRATFRGTSSFRAWLYRIATNACLDYLKRRPRPDTTSKQQGFEVLWLQPYPDRLLEDIPAPDAGPEAEVVSKETIELAFIVAIQQLTANQRAVLILRDVLGWRAKDAAELLETSVPSVNSALQRARGGLKRYLPQRRLEWEPGADPTREERELLQRYIDAIEQADQEAMVTLIRKDARFAMPPEPQVLIGNETMVRAWAKGGAFDQEGFGQMRGIPTRANMQPTMGNYVKYPGTAEYVPLAVDVLRIEGGAIAEIIMFPPELFPALGLPPTV
jgi:RNA polymerase sigma-70 factor (ECF subfamily)